MKQRILIVARGGIGNVLLFVPTLKGIQAAFPDSEIHMLTSAPGIDALLAADPRFLSVRFHRSTLTSALALRRLGIDRAVVMHPGGLRSAVLARLSGAAIRVGIDNPLLRGLGSLLYTDCLDPEAGLHDAEQNTRLIEALAPGFSAPFDHRLSIPSAAAKLPTTAQLIGLQPGSNPSQTWKRWPARNYRTLVERLASEPGIEIIVFGSEDERTLIEGIVEGAGPAAKVRTVIGAPLPDCAALIAACDAFVGNDAGLLHVASAMGVPTLCIAGPTNIRKTRPLGAMGRVVNLELDCLSCYDCSAVRFQCARERKLECLEELPPETVHRALLGSLEAVAR